MSLLIELKERRTHVLEELNRVEDLRAELADFDRVIAALEPEAVADEWHEDFLALTDEQPELFEDEPQEIEAPALADPPSAELRSVPGAEEEVRDQFEEEAERAAAIELTADVMPESGLHDDWCPEYATAERPALNEAMQDEREQPVTDVAALIASGEHSYDEVAAIAYPEPAQIAQGSIADVAQPEWNGPTLPGGYAPVTSPEADEAAKAHEYYDPKAVAERDRNAGMARLFSYNPFYKPKVDA